MKLIYQKLKNISKYTGGWHHISHMINILENKFTIDTSGNGGLPNHISLQPLINYFNKL